MTELCTYLFQKRQGLSLSSAWGGMDNEVYHVYLLLQTKSTNTSTFALSLALLIQFEHVKFQWRFLRK